MLRDLMLSTLPSLRVISLVYTGLGGVAAMVLVIAVAIAPSAPIAQQVVEPARQAFSNLTLPSNELVTSFVTVPNGFQVPVMPARSTPAPFVSATMLDITINPIEEPVAAVVVRPVFPRVAAPALLPVTVEELPVEEEQPPEEVSASPSLPEVAQPADTPILRIASVEEPKVLPVPTLTPQQVKARQEAENQAAIEAARAVAAHAKAEAEAANKAAIDAQKRAETQKRVAAATDSTLALAAAPAPRVSAKAAAEVAKEAATKAKAAVGAGNQAAIEAAKATKSAKH
jgi:hypothetical protein